MFTELASAGGIDLIFCALGPAELCRCCAVAVVWRDALDPHRQQPWRTALLQVSPGISMLGMEGDSMLPFLTQGSYTSALTATWPGLQVAVPPKDVTLARGALWALPLAASCHTPRKEMEWPTEVDYRRLVRFFLTWQMAGALPICPCCAAVAFYQGAEFTRKDISTGWHAYLLCGDACSDASGWEPGPEHPLLSMLWANIGMAYDVESPRVIVQLRPRGSDGDDVGDGVNVASLEVVAEFADIWRDSNKSMAENILSVAVPCGHRLCIGGQPLSSLGVTSFFCEQIGKYALTSTTRVGRYLDDQPAGALRAHVFGMASEHAGIGWLPPGCLEEPAPHTAVVREFCPFCAAPGLKIRPEAVSLIEIQGQPSGAQPLHGELWMCSSGWHLWGWRSRRAGLAVGYE